MPFALRGSLGRGFWLVGAVDCVGLVHGRAHCVLRIVLPRSDATFSLSFRLGGSLKKRCFWLRKLLIVGAWLPGLVYSGAQCPLHCTASFHHAFALRGSLRKRFLSFVDCVGSCTCLHCILPYWHSPERTRDLFIIAFALRGRLKKRFWLLDATSDVHGVAHCAFLYCTASGAT